MIGRSYLIALSAPAVLAGLLACAPAPPPPSDVEGGGAGAASLALEPCNLSYPGLPSAVAADCGKLAMAENPARPDGRRIELAVAVLEAVRRDAAPDPLFLLAGGPGQAAREAFVPLLGVLDSIRQKRDIVLLDQRGTGGSNPLECEPEEAAGRLDALDEAAQERMLRGCLERWPADPRLYTTWVAAGDLDAVREALGYERINLYGGSYGTRMALTYLRRYPQRVRSVILDGVVPQDLALGPDWARDAQNALDLIFARCATDEACNAAFPDLEKAFAGLLSRLEAEPRQVELRHPLSGEPEVLEVDHELLAVLVQRLSYAPETVALLPLLLHRAARRDELATLAAQVLLAEEQFGSMAVGMNLSVLCAEDEPFFSDSEAAAASAGTYLGEYQPRLMRRLCAFWPRGEVPEGFKEPVESDVPVLLLSGEADPVTPPAYAERAARTLARSRHLVAAGLGHGVIGRGCMPRLAEEFLEVGSAEGLDAGCLEELEPTPFFLRPAGPAP